MENIRNAQQFTDEFNTVIKPFTSHENYTEYRQKVDGLKQGFDNLATAIIKWMPEGPVRNLALTGLLGNAYVVIGTTVGVLPQKVAA